jgi:thymidylate synthase ThyX
MITHSITSAQDTGLRVHSNSCDKTGIVLHTVIPNDSMSTASVSSYVAARYSRSSKSIVELLTELVDKGTNATAKMGEIYRTYGHASVADMAGVFMYIENIPSMYAARFFQETNVGAGMERSTRYQDFSGDKKGEFNTLEAMLVDTSKSNSKLLNQLFQDSQDLCFEKYSKWTSSLFTYFGEKYEVDLDNKAQVSALKARVFDTSRAFLPWGGFNKTSLGYLSSAREWSRLIGLFKGGSDPLLSHIGLMMEEILSPSTQVQEELEFRPEVDDLIRYTSAQETTKNNVLSLKEYLDALTTLQCSQDDQIGYKPYRMNSVYMIPDDVGAVKTLFSYISVIYPSLEPQEIISSIKSLTKEQLADISYIIFKGHTQHNQMPIMARNGDYGFIIKCAFAEMRDLNRHRAMGRFCPTLLSDNGTKTASQKMQWSMSPYLHKYHNPEFGADNQVILSDFESDLMECNAALKAFEDEANKTQDIDPNIYKQLWLFAAYTPIVMYGSVRDWHYLTHLRVRPGGHIAYRIHSMYVADLLSRSHPLLSALSEIGNSNVDPFCKKQFLDRG